MNDIRIFYNKQRKRLEIYFGEEKEGKLNLGIFESGKSFEKSVDVINTLSYSLNVLIEAESDKIRIIKDFSTIEPGETKEIKFKIDTKLTELKAPSALIRFKIGTVI